MRVALVPGVLALLPEYASLEDPVAELRAAAEAAVSVLGPRVRVVASDGARARVGAALVAAVGATLVAPEDADETGVLVVGNGSAKRTEKAPGHFDERAEAFDAALADGLRSGRVDVDLELAAELWADVAALGSLDGALEGVGTAEVLYEDAPFGVAYWVMTWV
ncbi:hypothetical protein FXB39_21060 [Nocardioides sp. BGMRC 2183]|nr:hypothetical protein FXB39_21060 [Nocardioides sp. BGMRC 2183]